MTKRQQDIHEINDWLIKQGRLSADAVFIVEQYVGLLRKKGDRSQERGLLRDWRTRCLLHGS